MGVDVDQAGNDGGAAEGIDHGIIAGALGVYIGVHAVGDVAVVLVDVHMVKQIVPYEIGVALVMVLGQAHILVQIDGSDLRKVQLAALKGMIPPSTARQTVPPLGR